MTHEYIRSLLRDLFVVVTKEGEEDRLCFSPGAMNRDNVDLYKIYTIVSDAQRKSEITYDFSYRIASKAVDVLVDLDDWSDDDMLTSLVDSSVPIYNSELMKIYINDWDLVDEYGEPGKNSTERAIGGWYDAILNMTHEIKEAIEEELIDD